ncbi:MAG: MFS transporter [Candidatus Rokuibacteriota bacterium]|nr:MAG: MFS transporter [Candidatus Rokubacteria bacterium]
MSPPEAAAAPAVATKFGALYHRDYRRYFLLALLGMTAESVEHVTSYWVIFESFHSPTLGGFAVISHWVPYLIFSVYAGALADRFDCRRLIQVSQGLLMLASLAWGALFLTGTLRAWHAAALLMVHGMAGVIASPPIQLIVHDIVGGEYLPSAIRLNAISRYFSMLVGPAVGGGLMLALGPGVALLVNVLLYLPLTLYLFRMPYTGHRGEGGAPRQAARFSFTEARQILAEVRSEPRIIRMIVLAGATSFFVGSAFQAQMPEYAHHHGSEEADVWYSVLFGANAAGAVIGAVILESVAVFQGGARAAIVCAAIWGVVMAIFPLAQGYAAAVTLLVLAGIFNIAFTSMAQALVQLLAPPGLRGRVVGLFNTSMLGLRAGSGVTVGVLGAVIGVELSLALSAAAVVLVALGLLAVDVRRRQ